MAALRLHRGLLEAGVDSIFLTGEPGPDVRVLARMPVRRWFAKSVEREEAVRHFSANLERTRLAEQVRNYRADVVHLHWVGDGFAPVDALPEFGARVVWTHHDLWAATGGCHYADGCRRFLDRCGSCPALAEHRRGEGDMSRKVWNEKARRWANWFPVLVTPSQWLAGEVRASSLFRERDVKVVPYGLDLHAFRLLDRAAARQVLGLPADRFLVLFGAVAATTDPRKGFAQLCAALEELPESVRSGALAVIFGAAKVPRLPLEAVSLGRLGDDISLSLAYAAADVVVVPSLEDNLPNIVLEAMACGRAVVAFGAGGIPEAVEDGVTGLLVPTGDAKALSGALAEVAGDRGRRAEMELAARSRAEALYSLDRQAQDYRAIYAKLI